MIWKMKNVIKKPLAMWVGGTNDSFVTFCKSDDGYIVPDI